MPAERLSLRKVKEVYVLNLNSGVESPDGPELFDQSINHSTVADYLRRAVAAGLDRWPLPPDVEETVLEAWRGSAD